MDWLFEVKPGIESRLAWILIPSITFIIYWVKCIDGALLSPVLTCCQ